MTAVRRGAGFLWEGVDVLEYKAFDEAYRDVTRQVLFGAAQGLPWELRYFEVAAGGHTTLERHAHPHAVVVVRGRGRVLVHPEIRTVSPHDLVHVPPMTWHQFQATRDEPLGFLCLVGIERDRPIRPTEEDLGALRADPKVAEFVRL